MRTPRLSRLVAAACVAAAACVQAAPDGTGGDALVQLLADRGLLAQAQAQAASPPAAERGLMAQVRDAASDMVVTAMNFLGVPYRRGGDSAEDGFDCSGFTRHIFEKSLGLVLPRRVDDQASAPGLVPVSRDELKPGDLVFFNTLRRTFSHVGIYIGDGKFIHSPRTGAQVRIEDMRISYWTQRFTGARRAGVLQPPAPRGGPTQAPEGRSLGTTVPVSHDLRQP